MEIPPTTTFPGIQENEKILSVVTPNPLVLTFQYFKIILTSLFFLGSFFFLGSIYPILAFVGITLTLILTLVIIILAGNLFHKRVCYITDRRIIRFEPSNGLVVNPRSLSWDNISKVKTFATSFLWRTQNIGTVIVHANTTATSINHPDQVLLSNDDIVLKDIYYYRDLGNYVDKIIYLCQHEPQNITSVRSFVAKPKGQRY